MNLILFDLSILISLQKNSQQILNSSHVLVEVAELGIDAVEGRKA